MWEKPAATSTVGRERQINKHSMILRHLSPDGNSVPPPPHSLSHHSSWLDVSVRCLPSPIPVIFLSHSKEEGFFLNLVKRYCICFFFFFFFSSSSLPSKDSQVEEPRSVCSCSHTLWQLINTLVRVGSLATKSSWHPLPCFFGGLALNFPPSWLLPTTETLIDQN